MRGTGRAKLRKRRDYTRVKGVKVRAYCRKPGGLRGFLRREAQRKSMPF